MTLTLHFHPLSSYCHKALIALYENGTPFETAMVDPSNADNKAAFARLSPMGKMPALVDDVRGRTVWEATIVIEYLEAFYPGRTRLIPDDADAAWQVRRWDRFFDNYIHDPMQRITGDRLRPEADRDPATVERHKQQIRTAYDHAERSLGDGWIMGDGFTLADCAAAPALFYANVTTPIGPEHPRLDAYLQRLMARPSYAHSLAGAETWFRYFPFVDLLRERYPALAA